MDNEEAARREPKKERLIPMKQLTMTCLLVVGAMATDALAQELLPAPNSAPQAYEYEAVPMPAVPNTVLPPTPQGYPPPHMIEPVVLYPHVRIKDPHKIHPLAVPTIVEVPDPNDRHCTVCIEICAPPCECVKVKRHGLLKRKMEFDYGKYEIDVTSRKGVVTIDYDT